MKAAHAAGIPHVIDSMVFQGTRVRASHIDYTHQESGVVSLVTFQDTRRFSITIEEIDQECE